ncbi:MAG: dipeptidase [Bacteroidetes bacterium]|nr:dipeptidase [Bacteroidota bacterium]
MQEFFVDIHCHSSMRAFHTTPRGTEKNIWDCTKNDFIDTFIGKWVWNQSKNVSKFSQSNFYNCIDGKVRVVFDSLYPVERGFINFKKIPELIIGKKANETLVVTASGVSVEQFRSYKKGHNYFDDLNNQYNFLVNNQGASPCGKYNYKIPANYNELEESLQSNDSTINVIVTIEGAHVFGCGTKDSEKIPLKELKQILKNNISEVKKWKHPPFFITFAHHFWNQLCGHATTLTAATKFTCNQIPGLNTGFTELGLFALEELLSTKNGKRILIDTRHMSAKSRQHYINYVSNHNKQNPNDLIPLISSHSAVNGFEKIIHSDQVKDTSSKKKSTSFCAWSLNISSEEAIAIHESGGIAGIILDKGRHSGINLLKSIEKIKNPADKKTLFVKLICDNIFFFVGAINAKSAWDILTIGSDFDGVITHFDPYENTSTLPDLKKDLINFLTKNNYQSHLWFGYSPEELMNKIFTQNAMDFLKRNFN